MGVDQELLNIKDVVIKLKTYNLKIKGYVTK